MMYLILTVVLLLIATILFVNIQLYLHHPLHQQWCDEWFARFEEINHQRFTDPELAWRYEVFRQAFHTNRLTG